MILELLNTAKAGLSEESAKLVASHIATHVEDGSLYATEAVAISKWLTLIAEAIKKDDGISEAAEAELTRNGGKLQQGGIEFSMKPSVSYDYTNSEAWASIKEDMKPLEDAKKEVEGMAKSISTIALYTNPLTGEELEVKPALRKQSDSVMVKLPKSIELEEGELPWA